MTTEIPDFLRGYGPERSVKEELQDLIRNSRIERSGGIPRKSEKLLLFGREIQQTEITEEFAAGFRAGQACEFHGLIHRYEILYGEDELQKLLNSLPKTEDYDKLDGRQDKSN